MIRHATCSKETLKFDKGILPELESYITNNIDFLVIFIEVIDKL